MSNYFMHYTCAVHVSLYLTGYCLEIVEQIIHKREVAFLHTLSKIIGLNFLM